MELKTGMICKHFKGETLVEKNIYEILAMDMTYTGDGDVDLSSLVVYRPLFQEGKVFAREYEDLVEELSSEEKELYHQDYRVEPLNEEELETIKTEEYRVLKNIYIKNKYEKKLQK